MDSIEHLEKLRIKIRNKMLGWAVFVTIIAFYLAQIGYERNYSWRDSLNPKDYFEIGMMVFIYICYIFIALFTSTEKLRKEMSNIYIDQIVIPELQKEFQDVKFDEEKLPKQRGKRVTMDEVNQSGLVRQGNQFKSRNSITGVYRGIHFKKANVTLEYKRNKDRDDSYPFGRFMGSFIILESNNHPVDEVYIISEKYNASNCIDKEVLNSLHTVELESVIFNSKFKVYAKSEREVFYMLTPKVVDGLLSYPALRGVGISKKGNDVYIAYKDQFTMLSTKLFRKVDESVVQAIYVDIQTIKDAIEIFIEMERD